MKNLHEIHADPLAGFPFEPEFNPARLTDWYEDFMRRRDLGRDPLWVQPWQQRVIEGTFLNDNPHLVSTRILRHRDQLRYYNIPTENVAFIITREDFRRLEREVLHQDPLQRRGLIFDRNGLPVVYGVPLVGR